jgi:tRNA threonylcarbamoyladenosine biosynthesis protein TsaE
MRKLSHNLQDTKKIAYNIAKQVKDQGGIIALSGDLGAGKTTFTKFLAQSLGIKDKIISPTFVLMRQHKLDNENYLFHLDVYRLEEDANIPSLDLPELFRGGNIVLIEWAEKIKKYLPPTTIWIDIQKVDKNTRIFEVRN